MCLSAAARFLGRYRGPAIIIVSIALLTAPALVPLPARGSGIDGYTVLLLPADGSDGNTAFSDSGTGGSAPHTFTANGNAQIDIAQSKFGGASALFDGTGDYIDTPDSEDWNMGTGNFTVDFWVRFNSVAGYQYVFGQIPSNGADAQNGCIGAALYSNGIFYFIGNFGGTLYHPAYGNTVGFAPPANTWYHVAFVRNGTSLTVYKDGVSQGSITVGTASCNNSPSKFTIGRLGEYNGNYLNGWVDELRVSKGIARWTSNFTPPTEPYTESPFEGLTFTGDVHFSGNLLVEGALSKSSGTFVIDHPQNPEDMLLYHSFVESNEVKNLYDGIVTLDHFGEATIEMPVYFEALNTDFRYKWVPIGQPMPGLYLRQEIEDNHFILSGGVPYGRVSWQVTGNRHDPYIQNNPIEIEVEKGPGKPVNKGECIYEPACE